MRLHVYAPMKCCNPRLKKMTAKIQNPSQREHCLPNRQWLCWGDNHLRAINNQMTQNIFTTGERQMLLDKFIYFCLFTVSVPIKFTLKKRNFSIFFSNRLYAFKYAFLYTTFSQDPEPIRFDTARTVGFGRD